MLPPERRARLEKKGALKRRGRPPSHSRATLAHARHWLGQRQAEVAQACISAAQCAAASTVLDVAQPDPKRRLPKCAAARAPARCRSNAPGVSCWHRRPPGKTTVADAQAPVAPASDGGRPPAGAEHSRTTTPRVRRGARAQDAVAPRAEPPPSSARQTAPHAAAAAHGQLIPGRKQHRAKPARTRSALISLRKEEIADEKTGNADTAIR